MPFRPLSFTKNLGGLNRLHKVIKAAYEPGISLRDFTSRIPADMRGRAALINEFFIATRVVSGTEYVVEDTAIRYTFMKPWSVIHARLYLFTLLVNMPGTRIQEKHQSPAGAHNTYVRDVLHDGKGWLESKLDLGTLQPWVRENVAVRGGSRKFSTNLLRFFDQGKFKVLTSGHLKTFANHWGPLAIRLFFDRYRIGNPGANVDELVAAANRAELYKLLGVPAAWQERIIAGCAIAYLDGRPDLLVATEETPTEIEALTSPPAGRRTQQISRLIQLNGTGGTSTTLFGKTCLTCGSSLPGEGAAVTAGTR